MIRRSAYSDAGSAEKEQIGTLEGTICTTYERRHRTQFQRNGRSHFSSRATSQKRRDNYVLKKSTILSQMKFGNRSLNFRPKVSTP